MLTIIRAFLYIGYRNVDYRKVFIIFKCSNSSKKPLLVNPTKKENKHKEPYSN